MLAKTSQRDKGLYFYLNASELKRHAPEDVLSAIALYFRESDEIEFIIFPDRPKLRDVIQNQTQENWAGDMPKVNFIAEWPEDLVGNTSNVVVLHELLNEKNDGPDTPLWSQLYNAYQGIKNPQSMYENAQFIKNYDRSNLSAQEEVYKIFEASYLKFMDDMNISSVIDIGCGAGAFWHLTTLREGTAPIKYIGYDYSRAQISSAIKIHKKDFFHVQDISKLPKETYDQYQAVHAWSVLPFMSREKQIESLKNILSSKAMAFMEVTITRPDKEYMPTSFLQNFSGLESDGKYIMTPITFLFEEEIDQLMGPYKDKYNYYISDGPKGGPCIKNSKNLSSEILYRKSTYKIKNLSMRFQEKKRSLLCTIVPKKWEEVAGPYKDIHSNISKDPGLFGGANHKEHPS